MNEAPRSLSRSIVSVGSGTALSRILGFVRDILMAYVIGTGPIADAFFAAFRFPNLFRHLFAEGAFNSAFIPLFAKSLEQRGDAEARAFARLVLSWLILVLVIITVLAEIFMEPLTAVFVPGFRDDPEKFELTVLLTRICFPYLACMSLTAAYGGILNGLRYFLAAAFAPVLLNAVLIVVLGAWIVWLETGTRDAAIALAWSVILGGILQLAIVAWGLQRAGHLPGLVWPRLSPDVARFWALALPAVLTGGITQINIFIGTIIASQSPSAISYLYYADRLYQLPLGIVGIAIGVVLLPELSRHLKGNRQTEAAAAQDQSLFIALLLTLPATIGLIVIAEPIIRVLFERGAFDVVATENTARALVAFGAGLPAFVLIKIFQPGYFAREDTRTPTVFAAISVVANIALSIAFFPRLQHVGIALATSISAWLNVALLVFFLARRGHFTPTAPQLRAYANLVIAATVMAFVLIFAGIPADFYLLPGSPLLSQIIALGVLILLGAAAYFLVVHLTGAQRMDRLVAAIRGKRPAA